jgi:hypothetical protein
LFVVSMEFVILSKAIWRTMKIALRYICKEGIWYACEFCRDWKHKIFVHAWVESPGFWTRRWLDASCLGKVLKNKDPLEIRMLDEDRSAKGGWCFRQMYVNASANMHTNCMVLWSCIYISSIRTIRYVQSALDVHMYTYNTCV